MAQLRKVLHLRTSGSTAPSSLDAGEIAIRYKKGEEALFISTTNGASDIVSFEPSAQVLAAAETYTDTKIQTLDGSITGSAGAGKTLTAFSQTDGKVSATFGNISITKSQISDFPTIPTVNNGRLSISGNSTLVTAFSANQSSNSSLIITGGTNVTVTPDATNHKITISASQPTVNNGTFTISGNGATVASTSANASANTGLNIKPGTNVQIETGTSEITISATDTKYTFTGGTNQFTYSENGGAAQTVSITPSISNNVTGSSLTKNAIVVGNGSSAVKTSGVAIETALTVSSDAKIPTSKAIADYVTLQMTSALTYKGSIGTGGDIQSLPASHKVGDLYVVQSSGTYAGKACEVGDYIICKKTSTTASDSDWDVINGENQVTNSGVTLSWGTTSTIAQVDGTDITVGLPTTSSTWTQNYYTTGLTVSTATTSNTITVKGNNSAVTGTAILSSATTSAAGLMSKDDKVKLNGIATGAQVNQNAWSKIKINAESTTIDADTTTDTLTVSAGTFVTLTSDANNDKFTIGVSTGTSSSTLARGDHSHSSYVNQNAFSNVVVGSTTIAAETATDTITISGSNVTLTPDATNDKLTIGITSSNVTSALGYTPYNSTNPNGYTTNTGTVTKIIAGDGLNGGTITTSGTISVGDIDCGTYA